MYQGKVGVSLRRDRCALRREAPTGGAWGAVVGEGSQLPKTVTSGVESIATEL